VASAQVEAIMADLRRHAAKAGVALILEIDANLRQSPDRGGTPVLTGHARASWVPSAGEPYAGEPTGANNGSHDAGVATLLRYSLEDGDLWLSNNAPYILFLNLGRSDQQVAGFIEACVDRGYATVQQRYDGLQIEVRTHGVGTFVDSAGGAAAENLASAYSPFGADE